MRKLVKIVSVLFFAGFVFTACTEDILEIEENKEIILETGDGDGPEDEKPGS